MSPVTLSAGGARSGGGARVAALALACAGAYLATASPWIQGGDSAEFALVGAEGGVPHPSGYPLYALVLRLFALVPGLGPVRSASVASAIIGVACIVILWTACVRWGATSRSAVIASILFAFSPRAWVAFSHPEVFGLNCAISGLLVAVCAPAPTASELEGAPGKLDALARRPLTGQARLWALGAVSGLGFSNHMSFSLLVPLGVLGLALGVREATPRGPALAGMGALAAAGLLPYAYLLVVAQNRGGRWVWNDPSTIEALVAHALRADYGVLDLAPNAAPTSATELLAFAARVVGEDLLWAPPLLALGGVIVLARQRRGAAIAYAGALALAGPIFISRFNLPPRGINAYIVSRFCLLPELLCAVPFALVIDAAARRVARATLALDGIAGLLLALNAWRSLPAVREHNGPHVEDYLRDTLASAPPGAVLIGHSDVRMFGFMFARRGLHLREDVVYVSLDLFSADWYEARVERDLGIRFRRTPRGGYFLPDVVDQILAASRPVLFTDYHPMIDGVLESHPNHPQGTAIRVLARGATLPDLATQEAENERLFGAFRARSGHVPKDTSSWAAFVHDGYARTWRAIASDHHDAKDLPGEARCLRRAALFEPPAR